LLPVERETDSVIDDVSFPLLLIVLPSIETDVSATPYSSVQLIEPETTPPPPSTETLLLPLLRLMEEEEVYVVPPIETEPLGDETPVASIVGVWSL